MPAPPRWRPLAAATISLLGINRSGHEALARLRNRAPPGSAGRVHPVLPTTDGQRGARPRRAAGVRGDVLAVLPPADPREGGAAPWRRPRRVRKGADGLRLRHVPPPPDGRPVLRRLRRPDLPRQPLRRRRDRLAGARRTLRA